MFTLKALVFAAASACVTLTAAPVAQARPGPVNPFTGSNPFLAYSFEVSHHEAAAAEQIASVVDESSFLLGSTQYRVLDGRSALTIAQDAVADVDAITAQAILHVDSDAFQFTTQLQGMGAGWAAGVIESIRAAANERLSAGGAAARQSIQELLEVCTGPTGEGADGWTSPTRQLDIGQPTINADER